MNAEELKAKLYGRHPATSQGLAGPWTVIEEYMGIDVLAWGAWSSVRPSYGRIGYEVKVSRSDYRREVLAPHKRARSVAFCHEFYFAVPAGMLRDEELAFATPETFEAGESYVRERCANNCTRYDRKHGPTTAYKVAPDKPRHVLEPGPERYERITCPACEGRGYAQLSLVEREAPTLWVPADVGLIEVSGRGCRVTKKAPRRQPEREITDAFLGQLVRYVSIRPDLRHEALDLRRKYAKSDAA